MAVTEKCHSVPSVQHSKEQDPRCRTPSTVRLDAPSQYTSTFYVNNIHCQSCVSYVKDILEPLPNLVNIDTSIADHTIRIRHQGSSTTSIILKELQDAAFDVENVRVCDSTGSIVNEYDTAGQFSKTPRWTSTLFMPKAQRKHIENCNACKQEAVDRSMRLLGGVRSYRSRFLTNSSRQDSRLARRTTEATLDTPSEKPFVIDVDTRPMQKSSEPTDSVETFKAMISIGGMTCATCVGTITKELDAVEFITSATVSLLANNATVVFKGPKDNVDKLVEAIEDLGYETVLDQVQPVHNQTVSSPPTIFRASLSLEGMTCGSCVGTITRGLEELGAVRSINVDLIGCSGVVEFQGKTNLDHILEKIDDLGYDAKVVKIEEVESNVVSADELQTADRTITLAVAGMYCEHCPGRIVRALLDAVESSVTVSQEPTLRDPRLTLTYTPSPPEGTARRFISIIEASDRALSVKIDRPPTVEERSRAIQRREQDHILWRLLFTFIVAIPTFTIGIVLMSLVPSTNKARIYMDQPIWTGSVTRSEWAMLIMTTPVMFFGADLFHKRSFKEIRALWRPGSKVPILRRFYRFGSMNLLISAGTSVAYFASLAVLILDACSNPENSNKMSSNNTYFDSVTFLSFFILIGRFLEAYSKAKTGDAVAMLSNLRPSEALLVESTSKTAAPNTSEGSQESKTINEADKGSTTTRIAVDLLEIGDTVIVPHGASPPADGMVAQADTCIFDESSLTGESKPVKKHKGEKVFAGSVNISQPTRMTVTEIGGTSMLDQIVAVVREGQTKRAPIERVADIITGYFVPVITLIAILVFVIWLGLGESGRLPRSWLDVEQGGWTFWSLEFAISVFVVACPCGIALAAPTALFVGGGLAAKQGILVRGGGEAFQEASKLDVIVFDKTGTLTEGKMQVTDCEVISKDCDLEIAFAIAKVLEESSNHPIAKAIVEYCGSRTGHAQPNIVDTDIEEVPGKGMTGKLSLRDSSSPELQHYKASIGNEALVANSTENVFLTKTLHKFQSQGKSTAILSLHPADSELPRETILVFAISDPLRQTTAHVLHTLTTTHKIEAHICTGDNAATALAIAAQLDVPPAHVRAGVLPADKAAYIKSLQHHDSGKRRIVAFVGDGTNDAAALASADVSIALSSGSDVAVNSASFILLNPDLGSVLELVRLAKKVFWRVKANFVWAGVYNVCLVPVAAGIFYDVSKGWRLGPVWASAAMAASSVSVVTSSLALRLPEVTWEGVKGKLGLKRRPR